MNPLQIFSNFLNMGNNPQQIAQMIISQNPNLQAVLNHMQQSGMNPIQFAIQYAKQNNININEQYITNMYQQMLNMIPRR